MNKTISLPGVGPVDLTLSDRGSGRTFLLLHGGAGPDSVAGFAQRLAASAEVRVLTPSHPGFGGTARPDGLQRVAQLAALYAALLDELDLRDVVVVGNSIGGWIAAEMALLRSPRIAAAIVVDAAGIAVDGHPCADVFALSLDELMQLSYHDPARFRIDPSSFPPAQRAVFAANRAALAVYGGQPSMIDPTLRGRLAGIAVPTLVVWGESDRVVDLAYGRAYADAIPGSRFVSLPETGHVPPIESPERLLRAIRDFTDAVPTARPTAV
jgi:pimeloyl-ACP methyl ester carboxylesterase